jgi:hypothetical protein
MMIRETPCSAILCYDSGLVIEKLFGIRNIVA